MKTYKEIIRGLREDRDLKQYDIAAVAGTTQQHYSRYETGESEMPIRVLDALADYYNLSADYIIGRTNCKEGVDGLKKHVAADFTVGAVISELLALSTADREDVIEFILFKKHKEACAKNKKQDGKRP